MLLAVPVRVELFVVVVPVKVVLPLRVLSPAIVSVRSCDEAGRVDRDRAAVFVTVKPFRKSSVVPVPFETPSA